VIGRRAAAAADDVHEAAGGELLDELGRLAGRFVVFTERVRQAGVWIRTDVDIGDARQLLDIRTQLLRT
jgi:hypothetical protein